jgi:hypothetical protein
VAIIGSWVLRSNSADPHAPQNWDSAARETGNARGPSGKSESPASDLNEDAKPQTTKALDDDPGCGIEDAIEATRESDASMSIRRKVEVMNVEDQVNRLITESLSEARSVVETGGTWEPQVHIVHSLGVQSMRAPGLHAGPVAKAKQVDEINFELSRLNGEFLITVSDVWIGEDTPEGFVAVSWDIPFSGRRKALEVEVLACCDRLACGLQKYRRSADGKVLFGDFQWGNPNSSSGF